MDPELGQFLILIYIIKIESNLELNSNLSVNLELY